MIYKEMRIKSNIFNNNNKNNEISFRHMYQMVTLYSEYRVSP